MTRAIRPSLRTPIGKDEAVLSTVSGLVSHHESIEMACEEAIRRQDCLARDVYAARPGGLSSPPEVAISDLMFDDFRQMHDLARKVVPTGLPNANRRFMAKACDPTLVEIEDLEETIRLCRCRMDAIEQEILNLAPASAQDAAVKLKFLASLMLDGGDLEVDFFAYLVEECAFVIACQLIVS